MKRLSALLIMTILPVLLFAEPVKTIPIDPQLRTGRLENGFTYYVRHNEEPKGQVCVHLVQNVGSTLEEDNEQGLAHFLEHMCFNGSEHFPGNGIISFLQANGVRFGADLNAYTGQDETVYSIDNIPTARPEILDSCLLIVHDWCSGLLLNPGDIDDERGVIREEWRSTRGARERMYDSILPLIYPDGCRYGTRLPIGKLDVIENFAPETLKSFYDRWYRPDLQCVVVVGDIDPDETVSKIESLFSGMHARSAEHPERVAVPVPDNGDTPVIAFASDKEQTVPVVYLYKKQDVTPVPDRCQEDYMWMLYIQKMMDMMISVRLGDMLRNPNCAWLDATIGESDFFLSKTKGAWMGVYACEPEKVGEAAESLYREMKRIELHGFTAQEYDNAKKEYFSQLSMQLAEENKISSVHWANVYGRNYIDNEPMPSPSQKLALMEYISTEVDLDFINFYCRLMPRANWTIIGMLPDGVAQPDVTSIISSVENEEIAAYEDKGPVKPLMVSLPDSGAARRAGKTILGYERYILSNGATLYVKNTDFNPNQIQIRSFSAGGTSVYGDEDIREINCVDEAFVLGGIGDLSLSELSRTLSGKQVSVTPEIKTLSEGIYGASTVEDFETLMQLVHLYFTAQRADEDLFRSYVVKKRASLKNASASPQTALNDTINKVVYNNHLRARRMEIEDYDSLDYGRIMEMAAERYADASDFTFILTGHFDYETMMPVVERYLASLPSSGAAHEKYVDRKRRIAEGKHINVFERKMDTPTAAAVRVYHSGGRYNLRQNLAYELMGRCLNVILTREIREKMGGTYSISAKASFTSDPVPVKSLQTVYQTDPARVAEIDARVDEILRDFAVNGPSEEVLSQVKAAKAKAYQENTTSNAWHSTILMEYLQTGVDFGTRYMKVINSISEREVASQLRSLLATGNDIRISMIGVSE